MYPHDVAADIMCPSDQVSPPGDAELLRVQPRPVLGDSQSRPLSPASPPPAPDSGVSHIADLASLTSDNY